MQRNRRKQGENMKTKAKEENRENNRIQGKLTEYREKSEKIRKFREKQEEKQKN